MLGEKDIMINIVFKKMMSRKNNNVKEYCK